MKKTLLALAILMGGAMVMAPEAHADLKELLGGKTGSTIGNLLEGVFTKTNIEVKDLAGTYEATGSAVTFKSENALTKAGGVAAAAAIEAQLDPYYKNAGLTGAIFTCDTEGNFTLKIKKLTLKGVAVKNDDGTFEFKFQAFGKISMGSMKAYVQKTPTNLEVMFDATKLKNMLSMLSGTIGGKLVKGVGSILDSYDGACMGFGFKKTGPAPATPATNSNAATPVTQEDTTTNTTNSGLGNLLKNVLKR